MQQLHPSQQVYCLRLTIELCHGQDEGKHSDYEDKDRGNPKVRMSGWFSLQPLKASTQMIEVLDQSEQSNAVTARLVHQPLNTLQDGLSIGFRLASQNSCYRRIAAQFSQSLQLATDKIKQGIEPVEYLQQHAQCMHREVSAFYMSQLMEQNVFNLLP